MPRSRNYINPAVCGKHEGAQWFTMDQAVEAFTASVSEMEMGLLQARRGA